MVGVVVDDGLVGGGAFAHLALLRRTHYLAKIATRRGVTVQRRLLLQIVGRQQAVPELSKTCRFMVDHANHATLLEGVGKKVAAHGIVWLR